MIKLIHGADFHLDSPFSGLTPEQAIRRRGEQRELLDRLAGLARELKVDLVLLSGDLLDSQQVYRETAQALARSLGTIPCPVFIAPGNHDFYTPGSVYATLEWPENVHIFWEAAIQSVELSQLGCTVYGRAFTDPQLETSPLAGFRADRAEGRVQLMCLHGDVAPQSSYGPISQEEIAASGLDYLALGHIHQGSGLRRAGETYWAYPGCPEGRGFDETGEKGVLYVEAEPGRVTSRFIPLAQHRYQLLNLDITGQDPLNVLRAALPEDTRQDIYRLIFTGEGTIPDPAALEKALAPRFYGLSVRNHTRLPQDLWARREEDTLTGLFLQAMYQKCQASPQDPVCQLAARFGLAALENGEDVAP